MLTALYLGFFAGLVVARLIVAGLVLGAGILLT